MLPRSQPCHLIAGLGVSGSAGTATAAAGGFCEGMSAPQNNDSVNQAPVAVNDTAKVLAGTSVVIKVLANDTDPDGDKLYVENASAPKKGKVCVERNGTIEYAAAGSPYNHTDTFTYGVTDGDRYRTATVTVSVEGVKPVRAELKQKLVLKKHSHKVKQRARVAFHNSNRYRVLLYAGDPKKERPLFQRFIYPGHTFVFSTKVKRLVYLTILAPKGKDESLVNYGLLNTRNGHLSGHYFVGEDSFFSDDESEARSPQDFWSQRVYR